MNDSRQHGARILWVTLAALVVASAVRLVPALTDSLWQDEAYTLLVYASHAWWYPFTDYSLPNNHMLFSALMSLWAARGDSVVLLRLAPALTWLVTLALMVVVGRRVVGLAGALLGVALLGGSALTEGYALALRGYAFSWPFALLMLAGAQTFMTSRRRSGLALYTLAAAAAIATLPTNLLLCAICVVWACAIGWRARLSHRQLLQRGVVLMAAGLPGLALYLPHMHAIAANLGWSDWARGELLVHWFLAALLPYAWLAPLLIVGWARRRRDIDRANDDRALPGLLLLSVVGVTLVGVLGAPVAIFPRNLLPTLPLLYLSLGGVVHQGVAQLLRAWPARQPQLIAAAALLVFACGNLLPPCAGLAFGRHRSEELCYQAYRDAYHPEAMLAALSERFREQSVVIASDTESSWAFAFVIRNQDYGGPALVDYRQWRVQMKGAYPQLLVAHSAERAVAILTTIGFAAPAKIVPLIDTGYFKLFELSQGLPNENPAR